MMMGTADEIIKAPEKGPIFIEDMPEEAQVVNVGHSAGLFNLGNTCYMNSTVQCLHSVPELKSALIKYPHSGAGNNFDQSSHLLTVATRDLFSELDKNVKPVAPMQFWMVLRKKYPQFGQQMNGAFMQQDAEECWTQLLYNLSQSLQSSSSSEEPDTVKALFGIEFVSRVHCAESGEESTERESVYSLKCHISHEVNHLHEGLKRGLKSELEKASPSLGRSAIYVKDSRINDLPRYLTIQFVRFFWKRESNQKAKILRKVDYPLVLDVFDLCSDDLRKRLEAPRRILREEEGKKLGLKTNEKSSSSDNDVKIADREESSNGSGGSSKDTSQEGVLPGKELQLTGIYDLVSVLTHKGRSADSGHYVAWVKQENGKWIDKVATETLSLIRTVRAYGTEREEVGRFTQQLEKLAFVGMRESVAYGFWNLSFNTLYRSTQVVAVLFGGMFILMGLVSAEQLTKYVFYCEWLIYAAWRLQDNLSSLLQSVGACEKLFQLMNLLPSDQSLSKGVKLPTLMGYIDFVNVSFHYPSRNMVPVLDNVNFSIHANETIAIVGVSGSGKSTLINLMLRLYEQTDGQIFIDHFPLRELDIRWLRENIGFVGQDPHLFNMDVKSNISYGCFRDIRLEDIEWAAKQAYAHNFISSLPNGYETIVNDNLLSRGQKQRIALARAILRDPAILVLDEPTSALDTESEYYIKRFLRYFKNDFKTKRTVIVVAHRMSTVEAADRILVMDCGKIVEVGNHNDLLCKDGFYARLWRMQADPLVY